MGKQREKYINTLEKQEKEKILKILSKIFKWEIKQTEIKKLKWHKDLYRIRVGKTRIVFLKKANTIEIKQIRSRWDTYKSL